MPTGTIIRLITDRGFGFIRTEQGEDFFFLLTQLQGVDYNSLKEGQKVEFQVAQGPDGSCAVKVGLAKPKGEQISPASQT